MFLRKFFCRPKCQIQRPTSNILKINIRNCLYQKNWKIYKDPLATNFSSQLLIEKKKKFITYSLSVKKFHFSKHFFEIFHPYIPFFHPFLSIRISLNCLLKYETMKHTWNTTFFYSETKKNDIFNDDLAPNLIVTLKLNLALKSMKRY